MQRGFGPLVRQMQPRGPSFVTVTPHEKVAAVLSCSNSTHCYECGIATQHPRGGWQAGHVLLVLEIGDHRAAQLKVARQVSE